MMIQREGRALVIVRQTDHMAQVARIGEAWGNAVFPPPEHREETLRAAVLHDNGWRDWEERPTLLPETGRPRNLGEVETAVHAAFYSAGVDRAVAIDPYTGLLVSLHAAVLYAGAEGWEAQTLSAPVRDEMSEVQRSFLAGQQALQRRLRGELSASPRYGVAVQPERLWPAYLRLRAWDSLSLFFVFDGMADRALDHVPTATGEATIALRRLGERLATATPWPFSHDTVSLPVVTTRVPDRPYAGTEDFLRTWVAAAPEVCVYTMQAR
jgi:hypothetical protein